jgi:hypothetical protein
MEAATGIGSEMPATLDQQRIKPAFGGQLAHVGD